LSIDLEAKISDKYWLRKIINENNGARLNEKIMDRDTRIENITWLSPLEGEDYKEYMLNSNHMLEMLNINNFLLKKEDLDFWTQRQPRWDGIGIGDMKNSSEKIIILVESKSDFKDLKSKLASKNEYNRRKILDSMKETYDELGFKGDFNKWFDALVIPKGAPNKSGAEAFINFLCDPDNALKNVEYIEYSTPNTGTMALLQVLF